MQIYLQEESINTMKDHFTHVTEFRVDELERLGLVETTNDEIEVTEVGQRFFCSHTHPRDLCEGIERWRRVREEENIKRWLAIRKEAALKIEPKTAEVRWDYTNTLDPYGDRPDLPEENKHIGKVYLARSPGSDVWVCFDDLPHKVRDAL
jgi:hypothetical protein